MSREEHIALSHRFWEEIWNQGNLQVIDELLTPDFARHDPGMLTQGQEKQRAFVSSMRTAFPDLHYTIDDQIAEGDKLATRYHFRGTHRETFQGIPPTGKPVTYTGILIHRFTDGKIAEQWAEINYLGLLQQLGAAPVRDSVTLG